MQNDGSGDARSITVELEPMPVYEIIEGKADIERLAIGESVTHFRLRAKVKDSFTYDNRERKGNLVHVTNLIYLHNRQLVQRDSQPVYHWTSVEAFSGNPTFRGRDDVRGFIKQNLPLLGQKTALVLVGERRSR